jgi:hypothetical protein
MTIDIERSDKKGYVQLKMHAWDGFEGTFDGELSTDGELRASGIFSEPTYILRPSRAWKCNLTGLIRDNRLKGNYSLFPNTPDEQGVVPPGRERVTTREGEGSFDLEKFKPLVQPR